MCKVAHWPVPQWSQANSDSAEATDSIERSLIKVCLPREERVRISDFERRHHDSAFGNRSTDFRSSPCAERACEPGGGYPAAFGHHASQSKRCFRPDSAEQVGLHHWCQWFW